MRFLRKIMLAIALYLALVIDGSLALYLHQFIFKGGTACLLLPIGVMLLGLFDDMNTNELWLAFGAGIIGDLYFLGIIGVYAVFLPLTCWLCQKAARFLPETFLVRLLVVLVGVVGIKCYSWLVLNLIGSISISFHSLLASLPLTLVWTLVLTLLTYKIWQYLAEKYPFWVDLDKYQN